MFTSFLPGDLVIFNPDGILISGTYSGPYYFGSFGIVISTLRGAKGSTICIDGLISFVDDSLIVKADDYDYNLLANAWYNKLRLAGITI